MTDGPLDQSSCSNCGGALLPQAKFCSHCGARQLAPAAGPPANAQKHTQFLHAAEEQALARPLVRLITIGVDGREGQAFALHAQETLCGRGRGVVMLDDPFVSPQHCRFSFHNGVFSVEDTGSLNGVFIRLRGEVELQHGDMLRAGTQCFIHERIPPPQAGRAPDGTELVGSPSVPAFGQLVQVLETGMRGDVRILWKDETRLGRENAEILFPLDDYISGQHCVFHQRAGRMFLGDLGSSNGTWLRVRAQKQLRQDDLVLVGRTMLRVDLAPRR